MNPKRAELDKVSKILSELKYAIDRFHHKNHLDPWCKNNCDPSKFEILNDVSNRFICELLVYDTFSYSEVK